MDKNDIVISVKNVTKDYGMGRGIFDISFDVPRGSVFGYCGTNGSGKTTTLRHIMGFLKPDTGSVTVEGLDSWKDSEKIKEFVGYLPGEIAFPAVESGTEFLNIQAEMVGLTDMSKAEKIINALQLDPTANLKRMSKGMKQKTAIVAAFMNSPRIIILDEPTTGLDPLMRAAFVNLIREEKKRGATILMSNHMFDELEDTCDYVAFIKDGHLLDIVDMSDIHNRPTRTYKVGFRTHEDWEAAKADIEKHNLKIVRITESKLQYYVEFEKNSTHELFDALKTYKLLYMKEAKYSLEKYFMDEIVKVKGGKK